MLNTQQNNENSKISVCIIAKNEEKMLQQCLQSVKDIAYEIIVVDTGSTDKTVEIAKNFNAKIYHFEWQDDFAAARNESIKYANGDFIFVIDADEKLLTPDALLEVTSLLSAKKHDKIGACLCNVISVISDKNGATEKHIDKIVRLFRNNKQYKFNGIIHEQIQSSVIANGDKIVATDICIVHSGYDLPANKLYEKRKRNYRLLEKYVAENPNNLYYKTHLAKNLLMLEKFEAAEKIFSEVLNSMSKSSKARPEVLNYAALNLLNIDKIDEAIELAKESIANLPLQSFANYILGEAYSLKRDFSLALEAYFNMQKAIENPSFEAVLSGDYFIAPEILHWKIGSIFLAINDFENAALEFEKGLKISPQNLHCLVGFANVAYKMKHFELSKKVLENAFLLYPKNTELASFIAEVDKKINEQKVEVTDNKQKKLTQNLISLCMIVKNEEKMLPGCLESVCDIVDEIIIVDTGSTDKTVEIAEKFGAKIYHFKWQDDFALARNESLKYATSQWILYLDADERLTEDSRKQIRTLLKSASDTTGGYFCKIESEHYKLDGSTEKHIGGYPRLFRNFVYPNIKFIGKVHEQISPSIIALNKNILMSDITIEHLGYNLSSEEMHQKVKRNYKILLDHIQEEPTNGYAWFQLGQTLGQMQLMEQAEEAIRFAIKCGNLSDSVYASAASTLSQLMGIKKDYNESLYWANETLKIVPKQIYGLSLKAHSLLYLGRKKEAADYFKQALEVIRNNKGIPQTGFDVQISEEILLKGLIESKS